MKPISDEAFQGYMVGLEQQHRDTWMWQARSSSPTLRAQYVKYARRANHRMVVWLKLLPRR